MTYVESCRCLLSHDQSHVQHSIRPWSIVPVAIAIIDTCGYGTWLIDHVYSLLIDRVDFFLCIPGPVFRATLPSGGGPVQVMKNLFM